MLKKISIVGLLLIVCQFAFGHGDVHERIEKISGSLSASSTDAAAFLKRGQLYMDAGHPEDAVRDFRTALKLAPQNYQIHFYLGQGFLALKRYGDAHEQANEFLRHADSNAPRARGMLLRGDIFAAQKKFHDAVVDYVQVLAQKKTESLPDDYLRVADTYLAADNRNTAQALDYIQRGIKHLGSLAVLEERAMQIEADSGNYDAALKRLDLLLAQSGSKAFLLYKKGTLLQQKGDSAVARENFQSALTEIDALPAGRASTPALKTLREDIQQKLAEQ